jgi:hypothetical protein
MKIDWRYRGSQDNLHGYSLLSGEIGISDDLLIINASQLGGSNYRK